LGNLNDILSVDSFFPNLSLFVNGMNYGVGEYRISKSSLSLLIEDLGYFSVTNRVKVIFFISINTIL
tara:strand:+ start:1999 stop:2199 length:201 start_codon:yes stop_codon:yes gene_type:complete